MSPLRPAHGGHAIRGDLRARLVVEDDKPAIFFSWAGDPHRFLHLVDHGLIECLLISASASILPDVLHSSDDLLKRLLLGEADGHAVFAFFDVILESVRGSLVGHASNVLSIAREHGRVRILQGCPVVFHLLHQLLSELPYIDCLCPRAYERGDICILRRDDHQLAFVQPFGKESQSRFFRSGFELRVVFAVESNLLHPIFGELDGRAAHLLVNRRAA